MLIRRTHIIILAFCLLSVASPLWREVPGGKPCKPGCTRRGNCNRELGQCECAFGWSGDACETNLLSNCQTGESRNGSYAANFIGHALFLKHMKSCACWLQLRALALDLNVTTFAVERWRGDGVDYCYERTEKGATQFSDPPTPSQPGVLWRRGTRDQWNKINPFIETKPPSATPGSLALPMDRCPKRCNERGTCTSGRFCSCTGGWKGRSCEEEDLDSWHCLRTSTYSGQPCSGRGRCRAGFCHCDEGYWGLDCSRSRVFELLNATSTLPQSFTLMRIYRYELPWQSGVFHFGSNDDTKVPSVGQIYHPFEEFMGLLSQDESVRTENIWEANLFEIPLMVLRHPRGGGNIGDPVLHLRQTIDWVRKHHPQTWNRHNGKDHFVWLPGDLGACWVPEEEHLASPIKIVHWGLEIRPRDAVDMPGGSIILSSKLRDQAKCFKAERDICVPNWIKSVGFGPIAREMWESQAAIARSSHSTLTKQRNYTLMFSGAINGWKEMTVTKEYSGGVRQAFYEHFVKQSHPDVLYVSQGGGPELFQQATFCLSPYGNGWGSRLPMIILSQCIPVIIQDYVYQPFFDVLPYESFSVILRKADLPQLMEILRSIDTESVQNMRSSLRAVYKSFYWSPELGGEAYNKTLESLWRRRVNLFGGHIKRG